MSQWGWAPEDRDQLLKMVGKSGRLTPDQLQIASKRFRRPPQSCQRLIQRSNLPKPLKPEWPFEESWILSRLVRKQKKGGRVNWVKVKEDWDDWDEEDLTDRSRDDLKEHHKSRLVSKSKRDWERDDDRKLMRDLYIYQVKDVSNLEEDKVKWDNTVTETDWSGLQARIRFRELCLGYKCSADMDFGEQVRCILKGLDRGWLLE